MIAMCIGCGVMGAAAGQLVDLTGFQKEKYERVCCPYDKDAIMAEFRKNFEFRPDLAATLIRAAFAMACLRADIVHGNSNGMQPAVEVCRSFRGLDDVWNTVEFQRVATSASKQDIIVLGALAALEFLKGPGDEIEFRWGRDELPMPTNLRQPPPEMFAHRPEHGDVTSASTAGNSIRNYLQRIDPSFTIEEAVALMASHSVGEFHKDVSGIDGSTVSRLSRHKFFVGVHYYQLIFDMASKFTEYTQPLGRKDRVALVPPAVLEVQTKVKHPMSGKMVSRQALVTRHEVEAIYGDMEARECLTSFAMDPKMWRQHYRLGFTKLINAHCSQLRSYVPPGADPEQFARDVAAAAKAIPPMVPKM